MRTPSSGRSTVFAFPSITVSRMSSSTEPEAGCSKVTRVRCAGLTDTTTPSCAASPPLMLRAANAPSGSSISRTV